MNTDSETDEGSDETFHRYFSSGWKGTKDEAGIPHTTMRDGAPNGYSIITFDGTTHTMDFKAALQPGSHLIEVEATDAYGRVHTGKRIIRVD